MTSRSLILLLLLAGLSFQSCKKDKDPETPILQIRDVYVDRGFEANTVEQRAVIAQMQSLAAYMKTGTQAGTILSISELIDLFEAGNTSISFVTTPYFRNQITSGIGYFKGISDASGGTYSLGTPNGEGGIYLNRLFDEYGLEYAEVIDKGLYAAALYNYAITFMKSTMTQADLDRVICLFGANPSFANSGSSNVARPDIQMANYAARRDKNVSSSTGYYTAFKNASLYAQAAIEGGPEYVSSLQYAIREMRAAWEKASAATAINYCHSTIASLSATTVDSAAIASGLHAYAECLGFIHGWKEIPQEYKIITDNDINELMLMLHAPYNLNPSSYLFATDALNQLPNIQSVISRLQQIYQFSDAEIEDFKTNWVAAQGR
jgi:hypothetical protein